MFVEIEKQNLKISLEIEKMAFIISEVSKSYNQLS